MSEIKKDLPDEDFSIITQKAFDTIEGKPNSQFKQGDEKNEELESRPLTEEDLKIIDDSLIRMEKECEQAIKSKSFQIVVDNQTRANIFQTNKVTIRLDYMAEYLEFKSEGVSIANLPLMDPEDIPEEGWRGSVKVLHGNINVVLLGKYDEESGEPYTLMEVEFCP